MGWNTSALLIENRTVAEGIAALPDVFAFTDTGETAYAEQAWAGSPGGRIYAAEIGGWCQLWDPDQRFAPRIEAMIERGDATRALAGTRALAVLLSGVTSTYGLWLYEDGELVRHAMFESGRAIAERGEPLAVESEVEIPSWGHDEDFIWAVIEAVTGAECNDEQRFAIYSVD